MATDLKNDIHRLLDEYDEEFGLEIGSSYELESHMLRMDSNSSIGLIGEIEREYNRKNRFKKWLCIFSSIQALFTKKKEN